MPTHCRRCFFQMKWAKLAHACTRRTRFPAFARPSASTRPESTQVRKPVQLLQRLPETCHGLIRPACPLWVCRTRRQGRRIRHGLKALPAAKTACHPVVLMMKGFTAATKRTAPGSATQGRAGRTDEAAQGSADGTGGGTRQSGQDGRSGVYAAGSGDNGANSRVMVAYGGEWQRTGSPRMTWPPVRAGLAIRAGLSNLQEFRQTLPEPDKPLKHKENGRPCWARTSDQGIMSPLL